MFNQIKVAVIIAVAIMFASPVAKSAGEAISLPSGYVQMKSGRCLFVLPPENHRVADDLADTCDEAFERIHVQLDMDGRGLPKDSHLEIRIVDVPGNMAAISPPGSPPPPWSSAVAYPYYNLIILSLHHANGKPVENLDVVMEHEISHLAMREILGDKRVPRWFSEGVAVMQSEGSSFARRGVLSWALAGDEIISLNDLENYPREQGKIGLAYAQAADFIGFLLRKKGWHSIRVILHRLRLGDTFDDAFQKSFGKSALNLEQSWIKSLRGNFSWLALLTGSGFLWGLITLLCVWAYFAVKKRRKERLKQMAIEEEPIERLITAIEKLEKTAPDPRPFVDLLKQPDNSALTKRTHIEIDGKTHTLH